MEQSYLIQVIRTLNKEEMSQIREFTGLTFVNNGKMKASVLPLLELCFAHAWDEDAAALDKERIYFTLFQEKALIKGKLEKLMVEAHKIVRAYLLSKKYFREENEFFQSLDYSVILRARGLHDRYRQLLSKLEKNQDDSVIRDTSYYFKQFLLEDAIHDAESLTNHIKGNLNVPNVLFSLELYYHIHALSRVNTFLLQQKIANLEIPPIIDKLIREIEIPEKFVTDAPVLQINLEIFKLLTAEVVPTSSVRDFFDLLVKHEAKFSPDDLRIFYTYLRNIGVIVANLNYDNEAIRYTLFDLYKDNLKRGYFYYEGGLPANAFLAVSLAAAIVKQFDWLRAFIESEKNNIIDDNDTKDFYRLGKAIYLFGIGKYEECLEIIPPTSPSIDYLLNGKRLELRALYEMQSDLFPYKLDAFKMFMSRTSQKLFTDKLRLQNVNFVNILTQIMNSTPGDVKRSELLVKRIHEKKQSADWRWLLQKAEALRHK